MAMVTTLKPVAWKIPVSNLFVKQVQSWNFNESDFGFHSPDAIAVGDFVQFIALVCESPILQVVSQEWCEPEGKLFWVNFLYNDEGTIIDWREESVA